MAGLLLWVIRCIKVGSEDVRKGFLSQRTFHVAGGRRNRHGNQQWKVLLINPSFVPAAKHLYRLAGFAQGFNSRFPDLKTTLPHLAADSQLTDLNYSGSGFRLNTFWFGFVFAMFRRPPVFPVNLPSVPDLLTDTTKFSNISDLRPKLP